MHQVTKWSDTFQMKMLKSQSISGGQPSSRGCNETRRFLLLSFVFLNQKSSVVLPGPAMFFLALGSPTHKPTLSSATFLFHQHYNVVFYQPSQTAPSKTGKVSVSCSFLCYKITGVSYRNAFLTGIFDLKTKKRAQVF